MGKIDYIAKDKKPIRNKFLRIRVSDEDRSRWAYRAASMKLPLSELARKLLDDVPILDKPRHPPVSAKMIREVRAIGRNLNQIAKAINTQNRRGHNFNHSVIHAQLIVLERMLDELISEVSK